MDARLRQLRQGPDGVAEYVDIELSADTITIGSAPDRDVQLLGKAVLPNHAAIRREGASLVIVARGGARVIINGKESRSGRLAPGDVIEIGAHRITVTEAPPGFDTALTIEPDSRVEKSEFESAYRTDLDQTWLSKRRTSWNLIWLLPLLIFLIPLGTAIKHRHAQATATWLPDDTWWSAGPLTPAHAQAAGRRCEACHKEFFVHVQDRECRKCHNNIADHVSPAQLAANQLKPPARCGECHEEHNSINGSLIEHSDSLCVNCHGRPGQLFAAAHLSPVSGFTQSRHPPFKATVLRPVPALLPGGTTAVATGPDSALAAPGTGGPLVWRPERVAVATGLESSNLKFSHAQHLQGDPVVRRSDNRPLGCGDCHVLSADGEHFAPVSMANNCLSCHELKFDSPATDRQLPHGKPKDAILLIQDYFAHRSMEPAPVIEPAPERPRLPGNPTFQRACPREQSDRGACRASVAIVTQFTRSGCVSCHVVSDNGSPVIQERFEVRPVRLVRDYFPRVHFNHRTHAVQKNLTGDAACVSCHGATRSEDTGHLMVPDRGKCLECHGDTLQRDRVALECVSCHAYHVQR